MTQEPTHSKRADSGSAELASPSETTDAGVWERFFIAEHDALPPYLKMLLPIWRSGAELAMFADPQLAADLQASQASLLALDPEGADFAAEVKRLQKLVAESLYNAADSKNCRTAEKILQPHMLESRGGGGLPGGAARTALLLSAVWGGLYAYSVAASTLTPVSPASHQQPKDASRPSTILDSPSPTVLSTQVGGQSPLGVEDKSQGETNSASAAARHLEGALDEQPEQGAEADEEQVDRHGIGGAGRSLAEGVEDQDTPSRRNSLAERFQDVVLPAMAMAFDADPEGFDVGSINRWLDANRGRRKIDAERLEMVQANISLLQDTFGAKVLFYEPTEGKPSATVGIPCLTVFERRGKSGRVRVRRQGVDTSDLHWTVDFPHLKVVF